MLHNDTYQCNTVLHVLYLSIVVPNVDWLYLYVKGNEY